MGAKEEREASLTQCQKPASIAPGSDAGEASRYPDITDAMATAGASILCDLYDQDAFLGERIARQIFEAMRAAGPN
jgi:hypothetical protein